MSALVAAAGGMGLLSLGVAVAACSGFVGIGLFGEGVDLVEDLYSGSGIADTVDKTLFFGVGGR